MRILHVYKTYYPDSVGGIEQVLLQLARGLAGLGVENRIFTLSPTAQPTVIRRAEAEVHRCPVTLDIASNPMSLRALGEFRRQLAWADVVHYQFPWPFGDLLHMLWAGRKPSIVSYQSDVVRQKRLMLAYAPLLNRFLGAVDQVVATSPGYIETSRVLQALRRPARVIPNGIDEATYPHADAARLRRWRDELGEGFFLFVGVLRYYKGLHTLVQAARGFDGRIVIVGDGDESATLGGQLAQVDVSNVRLLGHVSDEDKVALLHLARAFVFPSHLRSEAFGMSLVEAAMAGKPMVSCEIGTGTSYINSDGVTGWTVPPGDAARLREAMQRLQADPALAESMGRRARQRYEELFTAQRMAGAYYELYREVLAARR
jgi:O-antigen biosynthesis rhamnosyltransferase